MRRIAEIPSFGPDMLTESFPEILYDPDKEKLVWHIITFPNGKKAYNGYSIVPLTPHWGEHGNGD